MHNLRIERNPLGRLKVQTPDGAVHEPVTAVRAFPIQTPAANISPGGPSGHERVWFAVPREVQAEAWPTEDFELVRAVVETDVPEDDLFAGLR